MKFELGGYYKHVGGDVIHVCAVASSHTWDLCLICEHISGKLEVVSESTVNWEPISKSEYLKKMIWK